MGTGAEPRVTAELAGDGRGAVAGICEDRAGRLWICTSDGILGHIEEGCLVELQERCSQAYRAMVQDREGVLWIGTADGGPALYRMDGGHGLRACEFAGLEAIPEVNALCEHAGTLWVGTSCGLFAVDLSSGEVRGFTMDQGLSANCILSLGTDRQGRLWIGTRGGGALNYDGRAFHRLPNLGGRPQEDPVHAILCDRRGRLWFGTGAGLICYRPCHTSRAS